MSIVPVLLTLVTWWVPPQSGTASITVAVHGHVIEATLRAPQSAFARLPANAAAAMVAGSCTVRADDIALEPQPVFPHRASGPDTMVTAVVRYRSRSAPRALDVSCALFPNQTARTPHPNVVLILPGQRGRTALISADADGLVRAGIRLSR